MKNAYLLFLVMGILMTLNSCDKDEPTSTCSDGIQNGNETGIDCGGDCGECAKETKTYYFLGIEAATDPATDVLSPVASLTEGTASPVNNGFEQAAWTTFYQGPDQIIAGAYTTAPEFVSYQMENGELVQGESLFTDLGIYALDFVDESTMILIGSPREGFAEKKIYTVNTDNMTIVNTVTSDFGNVEADSLLGFPLDVKVRDNKMFVAYNNIHARGDFSTPIANQAKIAVFNYPEMTLEKIISDDRTANLGRYYSTNVLEMDENGDIYAYSPSALSCGYSPVPENNSGVLRIKAGETEFDPSYHIDFESISGGLKINDMFYVSDGKAVVRALQEDENNAAFKWATYGPTSPQPIMNLGILDLKTKSFTPLDGELSGGGWNAATLVEGDKCFVGVSNSTFAGIYEIDVKEGTSKKTVDVDGNYAKAILSLTVTK